MFPNLQLQTDLPRLQIGSRLPKQQLPSPSPSPSPSIHRQSARTRPPSSSTSSSSAPSPLYVLDASQPSFFSRQTVGIAAPSRDRVSSAKATSAGRPWDPLAASRPQTPQHNQQQHQQHNQPQMEPSDDIEVIGAIPDVTGSSRPSTPIAFFDGSNRYVNIQCIFHHPQWPHSCVI